MQSKTSLGIFKFLAGFVSVYHFILGLIAIFGSTSLVTSAVTMVYGVTANIDAQFLYMTKFIGAYMIVFAIATAVLAYNPVQYRNLVWVPVGLFTLRVLERLIFFGLLTEAFHITFAQDLRVMIPIAFLALALFYFRPRVSTA